MITGKQVAEKRAQLKLSRADFAAQCGLTASKIWRIETKGEFKPGEYGIIEVTFFEQSMSDEAIEAATDPIPTTYVEPYSDADVAATMLMHGEAFITEAGGWVAPPKIDAAESPKFTVSEAIVNLSADIAAVIEAVKIPAITVKKGGLQFKLPTIPELTTHVPYFDYDTTRYISHSEIATFQDCRRKWWLAYHRGLKPLTESPIGALAMGTRIHKALEMYYAKNPTFSVDPRDMLENLILKDWSVLTQQYANNFEMVPPEVKKKFDNEAKMQRVMIEGYLAWVEDEGSDAQYETIEPERYVEANGGWWHNGKKLMFIGRLDRLVRRLSDDAVLFEDFKTAASIPALMKILPINTQMKHYLMLLRMHNEEQYEGYDPRGALYTILRKSMQTVAAKPPHYARVEVWHNDLERKNYALSVDSTVESIKSAEIRLEDDDEYHQSVVPPRPSGDCSWKCPFFSICPMFDDGSAVESMIENHFTVGKPLDYYNPTQKETD